MNIQLNAFYAAYGLRDFSAIPAGHVASCEDTRGIVAIDYSLPATLPGSDPLMCFVPYGHVSLG